MRLTAFLYGVIGVLVFLALYMFSSAVDLIYKVDDIRVKIDYQRNKIVFLERVANELIKNCSMSVVDFERFARTHYGKEIHWIEKDNSASTGVMLIVIKKDSCIEKISFDWFF